MTRTTQDAVDAAPALIRFPLRVALCAACWAGVALIIAGEGIVLAWQGLQRARARRRLNGEGGETSDG